MAVEGLAVHAAGLGHQPAVPRSRPAHAGRSDDKQLVGVEDLDGELADFLSAAGIEFGQWGTARSVEDHHVAVIVEQLAE